MKYKNSYKNSTRLCHPEGISLAFEQAKLKKKKATKQEKKTKTAEFVIEKSKGPKKIGMKRLIANCSSGEKKLIKRKKKQKKLKKFNFRL